MRMAWTWLGWIAAMGQLSCGSEEEVPDTTPPGILSVSPASGATGVDPTTKIRIVFDEEIDNNQFSRELFHLARNTQPLYGQVSYDLAARQATLSMTAPLLAGEIYEAVLEPGVKDLAGNRRSEAYRWTFQVAE